MRKRGVLKTPDQLAECIPGGRRRLQVNGGRDQRSKAIREDRHAHALKSQISGMRLPGPRQTSRGLRRNIKGGALGRVAPARSFDAIAHSAMTVK